MSDPFVTNPRLSVAEAFPEARALFIRRTYGHLAAAVAAFIVLEMFFSASRLLRVPCLA